MKREAIKAFSSWLTYCDRIAGCRTPPIITLYKAFSLININQMQVLWTTYKSKEHSRFDDLFINLI